eukprot:TRINITY_DN1799_c0_g1_i1.p1 TRINITY_DN1799_c0_g1~~TRINITY_DN1799_c0_g1_i1.p1  ORF type:complete len:335 (-),score=61.31 TRINITY_DN1799_c0_g1_i1:27-1031(-)
MVKIHTLRDLDGSNNSSNNNGPNTTPLPNPWSNQQRGRTESQAPMMESGMGMGGGGMPYIGIDGYTHTAEGYSTAGYCCLNCCPCVVEPCSSQRKSEWVKMTQSFMFAISVVQIIMFIVELSMGGVVPSSENPMIGPSSMTLIKIGAKWGYGERYKYEIYRFVSPIFLHAGFIHIFLNLFSQLRYGLYLERQWGIPQTALIYFISGIGGCVLSSAVQPMSISVGASGAILGLQGANLAQIIWYSAHIDERQRRSSLIQCVMVIVMTMLFSTVPFIDWSGHLGGILVGFLVGCVIFGRMSSTTKIKTYVPIIGVVLCSIFFLLNLVLFYTVVVVV